jgi:hypothetical protein
MSHRHPVWLLLVSACVAWYSTITLYVSVKGSLDIRQMLRDLRQRGNRSHSADRDQPPSQGK